MVIAIASGKGGTGKTTCAVNQGYALVDQGKQVRLLDCDVEEPNDHLFVQPTFTEQRPVSVLKPVLDTDACTGCGACAEACNYQAIALIKGTAMVFNELCHSCGACTYVCPEKAFHEGPVDIGTTESAPDCDGLFFGHGTLNVGETLAPRVVGAVKELIDNDAVNIIDASPGTACPVVKALEDASVVVLVTEPTPFGLNDLKLAVAMSLKMGLPTGIIVNRSDGTDKIIADYAEAVGVPIIGRIPFKRAYAELAQTQVLVDNDVDAADLHLLFAPRVRESHPFVGGVKATIDSTKCIGCGKCAEACHFNAIHLNGPANDVIQKTYLIEPFSCEGCGLCPRVCPMDAIEVDDAVTGEWYGSATRYGSMAHARLGIAEENSGRLVAQVRRRAADMAREEHRERILGDGPPGTGCPVIASVTGTDLIVIVTEPTVSGVHDMVRVMALAEHFSVPTMVVVNKADLNKAQAQRIADIARARHSRVVGSIPFDRAVNEALMAGETVIAHGDSAPARALRQAWDAVQAGLKKIPLHT